MSLKKLISFIFISLLFLVGCEQPTKSPTEPKTEHEIWINTEAECCGVKDPLNNLKWIDETFMFGEHNESPSYDYCYFLLFRNNETLKDHIVVNAFIKTNCINSLGIPNRLNNGASKLPKMVLKPLTVNSSIAIKMATIYGKLVNTKSKLLLAPNTKLE
jgi:hypothetical protein